MGVVFLAHPQNMITCMNPSMEMVLLINNARVGFAWQSINKCVLLIIMIIGLESYPLHDELLQMCRATGLEAIATDSGLLKNGEISGLKDYSSK